MSFADIVKDDFGQPAEITFIDTDSTTGAAVDISAYSTTKQMLWTDPDGAVSTKTATFVTDGTDGKIQYTTEDGLLNAFGDWTVQGRVKSASATLSTRKHKFNINDLE